ncbi:MAG: hypothetical protein OXE86_08045 [Alphaproteobacteria bacterium]|nr:hypothetical protein [Alphaproteobacteria bacterium]
MKPTTFLRWLILSLLCMAPSGAPPAASSLEDARVAWMQGRFVDAARMGESLATSEGYALAARSLVVRAVYVAVEADRKALLERATALARRAVDLDPGSADAQMELARAIGRYAETIGAYEAANEGYAEKIRAAADAAVRLNPELAAAHLCIGGWHAGLVGTVGPFLARLTYGATEMKAVAAFERALRLAPDAKEVPYQYALSLLDIDEDEHREKAQDLLERAVAIAPATAHDRLLHARAVERLKAIRASGG